MADAITLATIGTTVLTEGVKFLYGQVGEVLKRWRERRDKVIQESNAQEEETEAVEVMLPDVFEGQLSNTAIHFDAVQQSEKDLRRLYRDLSEYANELEPVDSTNEAFLEKVDTLRQLLETVYRQRITFKGEQRLPSGVPLVVGRIEAKQIAGDATGVEAKEALTGEIRGEVKTERIEQGGRATGVRVDTVRGKSSQSRPSND